MEHLNVEQLIKLVGQYIDWHPLYRQEEWKDKKGPLLLTDVFNLHTPDNAWMISYKCNSDPCSGCKNLFSASGQFHHKLIKENGMDLWGYAEEIRVSKKKTEVQIIDQPVFIKYEKMI